MALVTISGLEAKTKWLRTVTPETATLSNKQIYVNLFTVLPEFDPKGKRINLTIQPELLFPAESNGTQDTDSSAKITAPRTVCLTLDETLLSLVSVSDGILEPKHKCYMAVTARLIDTVEPNK